MENFGNLVIIAICLVGLYVVVYRGSQYIYKFLYNALSEGERKVQWITVDPDDREDY